MFRTDGFLYRICTLIYHFVLLNFLFLISCIPIITIFPALAASFGVVRQWVKKNEPPIIPTYFKLFKENFKQSLISGIVIVFIGVILYADFHIITQTHSNTNKALYLFFCMMLLLYTGFILHVFPLMVNGYYSTKVLLINSLKISLYKFHITLLNLICLFGLLYLSLKLPFVLFFFFSSVSIFVTYWHINKKFAKMEAVK